MEELELKINVFYRLRRILQVRMEVYELEISRRQAWLGQRVRQLGKRFCYNCQKRFEIFTVIDPKRQNCKQCQRFIRIMDKEEKKILEKLRKKVKDDDVFLIGQRMEEKNREKEKVVIRGTRLPPLPVINDESQAILTGKTTIPLGI